MAGLLDTIKQQLQTPGALPQAGQTEEVRGLLRAKLGKQAEPDAGVPRQSSQQEQAALQQTRLGLEALRQQGQVQAAQIGQQQDEQAEQARQIRVSGEEKLADLTTRFNSQARSILDELDAARDTLDASRAQAKMEQAGFLIRGGNENYLRELQRQGNLSRLQNEQDFKYAAAQAVMADQQELFRDDLAFQTMINASDRELDEALSKMSDDFALKMGDLATRGAAVSTQMSGLSTLGSAGIQAAASRGLFDKTEPTEQKETN